MLNKLSQELLEKYVATIKAMGRCRNTPSVYTHLDKQRQDLHEAILLACGTNRDDEDFTRELANLIFDLTDDMAA